MVVGAQDVGQARGAGAIEVYYSHDSQLDTKSTQRLTENDLTGVGAATGDFWGTFFGYFGSTVTG